MSTLDIAPPMRTINLRAVVNLRHQVRGRRRAVWVGRLACRPLGNIHSSDRVLVWSGRAEPERVCGFHAAVRVLTTGR